MYTPQEGSREFGVCFAWKGDSLENPLAVVTACMIKSLQNEMVSALLGAHNGDERCTSWRARRLRRRRPLLVLYPGRKRVGASRMARVGVRIAAIAVRRSGVGLAMAARAGGSARSRASSREVTRVGRDARRSGKRVRSRGGGQQAASAPCPAPAAQVAS